MSDDFYPCPDCGKKVATGIAAMEAHKRHFCSWSAMGEPAASLMRGAEAYSKRTAPKRLAVAYVEKPSASFPDMVHTSLEGIVYGMVASRGEFEELAQRSAQFIYWNAHWSVAKFPNKAQRDLIYADLTDAQLARLEARDLVFVPKGSGGHKAAWELLGHDEFVDKVRD